jgi:hypothetical protein
MTANRLSISARDVLGVLAEGVVARSPLKRIPGEYPSSASAAQMAAARLFSNTCCPGAQIASRLSAPAER